MNNNETIQNIKTKIFYDNYSSLVSPSISPSMTVPPSEVYLKENNDPITNILELIWIIIQVFIFMFFSFSVMCAITYIMRIKLVREMRIAQGVGTTRHD